MSNLQGAMIFLTTFGIFFGGCLTVFLTNQVFKLFTGISPLYRLIRYIETH